MAFRVYLSHSLDPTEAALAWRMQTLATAHGIEMFVPNYGVTPVPGRSRSRTPLTEPTASWRLSPPRPARACKMNSNTRSKSKNWSSRFVRSELQSHSFLAKFPRVSIF
jgi:hypothetical protein